MIIFGLLLVPVIFGMIYLLKSLKIKRWETILLNFLMLLIAFVYITLSFMLHIEPFDFKISGADDYLIYTAVIFVFSPFLWVILFYYCKKLLKNIRIHKNAIIKKSYYEYYRDDLNKISPSILMFTSIMDIDIKKSIAATILKLKITKHLKETKDKLVCTNIDTKDLLETEKIVLNYIKNGDFDEKNYKKFAVDEAIRNKYIKKNKHKALKLVKMILIIILPIFLIVSSIKYDKYVFDKYKLEVIDDVGYIQINDDDEIGKIYNSVDNKDIFYHSYSSALDETFYDYRLIKADKLQYSCVRIALLNRILNPLFILFSIIMVFVSLYTFIEQIIYFNKSYRRTIKGKELLNKAYALKNFLKDFSMIGNRQYSDVNLWEYYLVYAVVLDVNVKIKNEIIEKYL